jgi:ferric-dicitrate binding protein FerR (iron transport regulator)
LKEEAPYDLIAAYLSGDANEEQKAALHTWIEASKNNAALLAKYRRIWEETQITYTTSNTRERYEQMRHQIKATSTRPARQRAYLFSYSSLGYAAAIVFVMAVFAFLIFQHQKSSVAIKDAPSLVLRESPAGQKSKFLLDDGSIVWLNSESTISYDSDFGLQHRKLTLKGEALFDVKKDSLRPFIVHTAQMTTEVLGTSFNINAYPDEPVVKVALLTGRIEVAVGKQGDIHKLTPGEQLTFGPAQGTLERDSFDATATTGWTDGVLFFKNASFLEVKNKLQRWYGVEIEHTGAIPQYWRFTGQFKNEYLANVMETMAHTEKFRFQLEGKKLIVHF